MISGRTSAVWRRNQWSSARTEDVVSTISLSLRRRGLRATAGSTQGIRRGRGQSGRNRLTTHVVDEVPSSGAPDASPAPDEGVVGARCRRTGSDSASAQPENDQLLLTSAGEAIEGVGRF